MKLLWSPLFFAIAYYEYSNSFFCGSSIPMWVMWFVMGLVHLEAYIETKG